MSQPTNAPGKTLAVFVIYARPRDYPHSLVLRRQLVDGETITPDPLPLAVMLADYPYSLETLRAEIPAYCVRIQGPGDDPDPCILEAWL